jgi:outer membrane receptor protein involved in Fe transport
MVYGLYTRGKRPGGVNRSRGQPFFPTQYNPDLMDNYEIGYKSNFAGGQGRFNATLYHMVWQDYQLELVDPASVVCADPDGTPNDDKIDGVCGQPWQQVVGNAGDAHITGLNVEIDYAINENWLVGMNYEKMEAETDTNVNTDDEDGFEIVAGLRLPVVPSYKASAWLEYSSPASLFGAQNWFFRTQWSHTGDSLNILEPIDMSDPNPQFKNPAYTIGDVRVGLQGEDWEASVFINNVTDERATYTTNTGMMEWAAAQVAEGRPHHQTLFTNRPMEMGIRFMKRWGD